MTSPVRCESAHHLNNQLSPASDLCSQQGQSQSPIRAGADAIAFFRQCGGTSSTHFFQCNRAHASKSYRPYDLIVADDGDLDRHEHFHISELGVTHILAGRWSDHVPLDVWDRESKQFDRLCQLGFFRNFVLGRSLQKWRKAIRRLKFEQLRRRIAERAFVSKPEYLRGLQNIAEASMKLQAVPLITLPSLGKQYEVDRWADLQISSREQHVKPALDAVIDTAQQEVEGICRVIGKRAKEWAQSVRSMAELADDTGVDVLRGSLRAMVTIKAEKQERARSFKRVMDEAGLMGNFVRLADMMLAEALLLHVVDTVKELLEVLQASDNVPVDAAKGMFITTVSFAPDKGMRCSPDGFSVSDTIMTNAVEGAIALIASCPRLLMTRSFVPFYDMQPSLLSVSHVIRDMPEYKGACLSIEGVISRDFAAALECAASLEDKRTIFDTCCAIDEELRTIRTRDDVHNQLQRLVGWHRGFSGLSEGFGAGCLFVDIAPMKALVMPAVTRAIEAVKAHAVVLAHSACVESLSEIRTRTTRLLARPEDTDSFGSFQEVCRLQQEEYAAVLIQAVHVDELYSLLAEHEQRAPMADQVRHDDLKEARITFAKALEDAEAYLLKKMPS